MRSLLLLLIVALRALQETEAVRTLPLVPHHVQRERRRHLLLQDTPESTAPDRNHSTTTPPRRLHRARLSYNDRNLRAQQVGALYQGYGTHYVDLWCGTTTPQRQTVIVDTGSAVTAFPCSGCRDMCGKDYHIDQVFDESLSSSFEPLSCNSCMRGRCTVVSGNAEGNNCIIGMSYQEGSSWTAFEAKDYCYVGGPHGEPLDLVAGASQEEEEDPPADMAAGVSTADIDPQLAARHAFKLVFGCQTKLTGLFKTQLADGIMGMDSAAESFWRQMSAAHKMKEDIFTLCFARQPTADRKGTEAGAMTLGGVDTRLHTSPIVYVGVTISNSFYGIHLRNVYLRKGGGGDSALSSDPSLTVKKVAISEDDLNRATTIVDSGTTDTYFTRNIASAFQSLWKEMTGNNYNNSPVSLTKEELDNLPTILFQVAGLANVNEEIAKASSEPIAGLAGSLDPDHPYDVLWAMPPSHYMEFDDDLKKYVPRFYTDEGRGSVLGANVMMGHDIIFDQVNGKLGIAESNCDYVDLVTKNGFQWNKDADYKKVDSIPEAAPNTDAPNTDTQMQSGKDQAEAETDDKETELHSNPTETHNDVSQGFCESPICQVSVVLAVLVTIAIGIAMRVKMSSGAAGIRVPYSSELELQRADENGTYRDKPMDPHSSDSDEEFEDEK